MGIPWFPIAGSLISGVTSAFGSSQAEKTAAEGYASAERSTHETNVVNAQMAAANRDFQERMSSTAYQRAVEDMKRAGLNPAVMFSPGGGSSASSPQGTVAQMQNTAQAAITSAGERARIKQEQMAIAARTGKDVMDAGNSAAQQKLIDQQTSNAKEQNELIKTQVERMQKDIEQAGLENRKLRAELVDAENYARYMMKGSYWAPRLDWMTRHTPFIGPLLGALGGYYMGGGLKGAGGGKGATGSWQEDARRWNKGQDY